MRLACKDLHKELRSWLEACSWC